MDEKLAAVFKKVLFKLEINGVKHALSVKPRVTLLDLLREQLQLTGTKKAATTGNAALAQFT